MRSGLDWLVRCASARKRAVNEICACSPSRCRADIGADRKWDSGLRSVRQACRPSAGNLVEPARRMVEQSPSMSKWELVIPVDSETIANVEDGVGQLVNVRNQSGL